MKLHVLTLFPEMILQGLAPSIIGRAVEKKIISLDAVNIRDYTLDKTWYGRLFIACYYAISPTIVKLFGNKEWFKSFCRKKLDAMVSDLKSKGVEDTKYIDKY